MKFISWNVNGLRAVMKKGFHEFFEAVDADIFALQETKMQADQITSDMEFEGYYRYMNSAERKGYSGTMVYCKEEPLSVQYDIDGDSSKEGRVITLEYPDYYFVTAYVPNSKEGLVRLGFRLEWEDALRAHLKQLNEKKAVVYTGDLNVAHEEIDLKNPQSNHKNPGFSDEEREKMSELLASGYVDSFRYLYPEEVKYSWWSYRAAARERNVGWRIDYFIVSKDAKEKVKDSLIYDQVMGSDHCPVGLELDL
ncbi:MULTISPECIES: exodeoxyribonuclease III [Terrabacteria group]|uniref:exodeoxyribonuclease III n=1 Tax=Bacillati TaxID=1783272 RepID=UPI001C6E4E26|nr:MULTISPECIES: exodeoxyribonuclease III [Terrabacteria group]MBW9212718.1 exodeoxyribonuclease III [Trueperella sp. zg.1013]